jgi:hypothetical protein
MSMRVFICTCSSSASISVRNKSLRFLSGVIAVVPWLLPTVLPGLADHCGLPQ